MFYRIIALLVILIFTSPLAFCQNICPKCRKKMQKGWKLCPYDGEKLKIKKPGLKNKRNIKSKKTIDIIKGYKDTRWGMSQKEFLRLGKRLSSKRSSNGYGYFIEKKKDWSIEYRFVANKLVRVIIHFKSASKAYYRLIRKKLIEKYGQPTQDSLYEKNLPWNNNLSRWEFNGVSIGVDHRMVSYRNNIVDKKARNKLKKINEEKEKEKYNKLKNKKIDVDDL